MEICEKWRHRQRQWRAWHNGRVFAPFLRMEAYLKQCSRLALHRLLQTHAHFLFCFVVITIVVFLLVLLLLLQRPFIPPMTKEEWSMTFHNYLNMLEFMKHKWISEKWGKIPLNIKQPNNQLLYFKLQVPQNHLSNKEGHKGREACQVESLHMQFQGQPHSQQMRARPSLCP